MKQITFFLMILCQTVFGQENKLVAESLIGNWEGAFIKNNAYQKLEIEFSERKGKVFGLQIMEEWHPTFGEFEVPVEIDSMGNLSLGTGYGKAVLALDQKNLELIGQVQGFNPAIYVHLKKVASKPEPNYQIEAVSIKSGAHQLSGHLHSPKQHQHNTAVIIVEGRGCYAGATQYNLYAKFLRKYGISVLAYQKQGTGKSTGDCSKATIQNLADDLIQVQRYLKSHQNQYKNIGVLGISAGAWTMAKAEEKTDFDFMISIVGPATSVKDQQLQSMEYGAKFYQLTTAAKEHLENYTNLMFDAKANENDFAKMNRLLSIAEQEQWKALLDDTDIPGTASEINDLWVRRHQYDPKATLSSYKHPFLAIYGDRDWIVPYKENVAVLQQYFSTRKDLLKTVVAANADHGMEMEAKQIDLSANQSYWHFYRVSPEVQIELAEFIKKNDL